MSELKSYSVVASSEAHNYINGEINLAFEAYDADDVDALLAKKEAAIEELKAKLENVQASMYADVVDANMENRRLKRALWLARANSADGQFIYWCARFGVESGFTKADVRGYSVNTKRKLRMIREWIEVWKKRKKQVPQEG